MSGNRILTIFYVYILYVVVLTSVGGLLDHTHSGWVLLEYWSLLQHLVPSLSSDYLRDLTLSAVIMTVNYNILHKVIYTYSKYIKCNVLAKYNTNLIAKCNNFMKLVLQIQLHYSKVWNSFDKSYPFHNNTNSKQNS